MATFFGIFDTSAGLIGMFLIFIGLLMTFILICIVSIYVDKAKISNFEEAQRTRAGIGWRDFPGAKSLGMWLGVDTLPDIPILLTVAQAREININKIGPRDVFLRIECGHSVWNTSNRFKSNLVWNEQSHTYIIPQGERKLDITLFRKNLIGSDKAIAKGSLSLTDFLKEDATDELMRLISQPSYTSWVPLFSEGKINGRVKIILQKTVNPEETEDCKILRYRGTFSPQLETYIREKFPTGENPVYDQCGNQKLTTISRFVKGRLFRVHMSTSRQKDCWAELRFFLHSDLSNSKQVTPVGGDSVLANQGFGQFMNNYKDTTKYLKTHSSSNSFKDGAWYLAWWNEVEDSKSKRPKGWIRLDDISSVIKSKGSECQNQFGIRMKCNSSDKTPFVIFGSKNINIQVWTGALQVALEEVNWILDEKREKQIREKKISSQYGYPEQKNLQDQSIKI